MKAWNALETRELTYFLAVADALHFGRAAAELGIAQPALSRAILRLERRLDVRLFERNSRAVALTASGRILAQHGRVALDAVAAAAELTRRAGTPDPRLVLAVKPGGDAGLLPTLLAAYQAEPDVLPIDVVFAGDRVRLLRDGRADAAILNTPADDLRGLDTEVLVTEAPVAVLPAAHPLAGRPSIRMADLDSEHLHRHDAADGSGPASIEELMHRIALGHTVAVLPESLTVPLRTDLATVPVTDASPSVLHLAWPDRSTSLSLAALVRAVSTVVGAPRSA